MGRVTVWTGATGPLGAPPPAHAWPSPPDGPAVRTGHARSIWMAQAGQDCGFPHPRAGPKVSSQSSQAISSARYLNSIGSCTALVALAEKQNQALSHLERELVRAGSRWVTPRGSCYSPGAGNASTPPQNSWVLGTLQGCSGLHGEHSELVGAARCSDHCSLCTVAGPLQASLGENCSRACFGGVVGGLGPASMDL